MYEIDTLFWILSAVVILLSAVLKGITGFGFALMAVPLLSLFLPVHMLIPAMSLFNMFASIYLLSKIKIKLKARYYLPMFLASLAGIPVGVYAFENLNENLLQILVGVVILVFSLILLFGGKKTPRFQHKTIVFAGFLGGLLGSGTSISGPPIALAMNRKKYSRNLFRANFAIFGLLSSFFTSLAYLLKGFLVVASVKFTAFLFPLLLIGTGLGNRLAVNIRHEPFRKMVLIINLLVGIAVVTLSVI